MMAGTARLRVAAAQYPIEALATFDAWRDKQARWIAEGAATGAQLLVFPEYGLMEVAATFGPTVAADLFGSLAAVANVMPRVDATIAELARANSVHVLAASGPARRDGRYVNAARLFAPSGAVGVAEKVIMTPFERTWGISGGAATTVFDTVLGRLGVTICYDSEFPLLARAACEAGAEVLLVPSCTERISGYHRVRCGAMARALENGIASVVSPTVGDAPWSPAVDHNRGAAAIFVPAERDLSESGVVAEGRLDMPGWTVGDIDLQRLRVIRDTGEMRNSRDWTLQPGAAPLSGAVQVITVR